MTADAEHDQREPVSLRPRVDGWRVADALAGQWIESAEGAVLVVDRYYAADRRHGRDADRRAWSRFSSGAGRARRVGARMALAADARIPEPRAATGGVGSPGHGAVCAFSISRRPAWPAAPARRRFWSAARSSRTADCGSASSCCRASSTNARCCGWSAEWTARHDTLVTFNGRSFDVPLIETRYLLHRLACPLVDVPHLDMLHPARRLWKQRPTVAGPALDEDSCRLSVLERHLAGYHRVGDVPGFEIPSRFFRFVQERRRASARSRARAQSHRSDLAGAGDGQAMMLIRRGRGRRAHPREALGLGRLYERSGANDKAEACYARAASLAAQIGPRARRASGGVAPPGAGAAGAPAGCPKRRWRGRSWSNLPGMPVTPTPRSARSAGDSSRASIARPADRAIDGARRARRGLRCTNASRRGVSAGEGSNEN